MATAQAAPQTARTEQRFVMHAVDWRTYELLLEVIGNRAIRVTYDRGVLELMSPSDEHERFKRLIGRLLETMTFELNIPIRSQGSTTWKRESLDRGLEPDECYYIQSEPLLRGRNAIDLEIDPPPDLAVEVEMTRSALDRMGVYAALGVPEVWRFNGDAMRVFELDANGHYVAREGSVAFPFLPLGELTRFLSERDTTDETTWIRRFAVWVRDTLAMHERPSRD